MASIHRVFVVHETVSKQRAIGRLDQLDASDSLGAFLAYVPLSLSLRVECVRVADLETEAVLTRAHHAKPIGIGGAPESVSNLKSDLLWFDFLRETQLEQTRL